MGAGRDTSIRYRRIFFLPGSDPFLLKQYFALYRGEGRRQAGIAGYHVSVAETDSGWTASFAGPEGVSSAAFTVLDRSDILRGAQAGRSTAVWRALVRCLWRFLAGGALWRLVRLRRSAAFVAITPLAILAAQALLAGLLGLTVAHLAFPAVSLWAAAGLGLLASLAVLQLGKFADRRLHARDRVCDLALSTGQGDGLSPALRVRLAVFAGQVAAALRSAGPQEEVLIVAHSSGVHLAVAILARLIRDGRIAPGGPPVGFLSLGQTVPVCATLPESAWLRRDLATVAGCNSLTWVDITDEDDPSCFAACDPSGFAAPPPDPDAAGPLILSAAFRKTLQPATRARMRWRLRWRHTQYLCAFDRPGAYDYFRITAGPLTLAARFAGQTPSALPAQMGEAA